MKAISSSKVLDSVAWYAAARPEAIALISGSHCLSYRELQIAVDELAAALNSMRARTVGIVADNGIAWALADLAALSADLPCVPIPLFFSSTQTAHAMASAGVDLLLVDARLRMPMFDGFEHCSDLLPAALTPLLCAVRLPSVNVALPEQTRKITFTSGTTGSPKGVCLGISEQEGVAEALIRASRADRASQHLCVLPLATLLENIGGLYAPLLAGATTHVPSLADVGLSGASALDVHQLLAAIDQADAGSVILVPQMLQAMVMAIEAGAARPTSLRFVAVGGAAVSPRLIDRARALGLPVFEGYGLSECASVVALNSLDRSRPGSVGKPLSHVRIQLAFDGEILVFGNAFRGYVGEPPIASDAPVATGDLGYLDEDGFLHIIGRKKNIFVTAFGRNVSPEWVESELCVHPVIAQAAVFGEASPWNAAVIVPRLDDVAAIQAAIDSVNQELPDYARVRRWMLARAPFSAANGHATSNGRLCRGPILSSYGAELQKLYGDVAA